jgi:hypothetical protein
MNEIAVRRFAVGDYTWFKIVAVGWMIVMILPTLQTMMPTSYWMTVSSLYVNDAPLGSQPKMEVERKVHRPFQARWYVEIERRTVRGTYYLVCRGQGEGSYSPDSELPENLDLEWWAGRKCDLPAAEYRVETTWVLPQGQVLRKFSNVFEIRAQQSSSQ